MKRNSQIVGTDEPQLNIIKNMYNKTISNITFDKKLRISPLRSGTRQGSHFATFFLSHEDTVHSMMNIFNSIIQRQIICLPMQEMQETWV